MPRVFELIAEIIPGFLGLVLVAVLSSFWLYYFLGTDKLYDRRKVAVNLKRTGYGNLYKLLVGKALTWLDRSLTPAFVGEDVSTESFRAASKESADRIGQSAWNWPLLDLSLRFALIYPVVLLFLLWAVTGRAGGIGGLIVLPAGEPWWIRYAAIGVLANLGFWSVLRHGLSNRLQLPWLVVAVGLIFAFAFAGAYAGAV
ncbi:MAG: hypothetical protein ACFB6S_19135 [Geminicoccaceae bacterium]